MARKEKTLCGLIGCGHIAKIGYAPALNQNNCPLTCLGLYSRSSKSAKLLKKEIDYPVKIFRSFEELADSNIDCAIIAAPNHLHNYYIEKSLAKGLDVLCEKPVTNTLAQARILKRRLRKSRNIVMIGYNQRYLDRYRKLKSLLDAETIGEIQEVFAYHNQNLVEYIMRSDWLGDKEKSGGGVLHEAGTHLVNMLLHLFGGINKVYAEFSNIKIPDRFGEDTVSCKLSFHSGIKGTLLASWANGVKSSYEHMIIIGKKGIITTDAATSSITLRSGRNKVKTIPCVKERIADSIYNELMHFYYCINSRTKPQTDIDDAIETLKVTEAARISATTNKEITIDTVGCKTR